MNIEQLKGQWNQLRGNAKEQWGELTDDDLTEVEGEFDQLVGKIQEHYGIAKEDARLQVNGWLSTQSEPTH